MDYNHQRVAIYGKQASQDQIRKLHPHTSMFMIFVFHHVHMWPWQWHACVEIVLLKVNVLECSFKYIYSNLVHVVDFSHKQSISNKRIECMDDELGTSIKEVFHPKGARDEVKRLFSCFLTIYYVQRTKVFNANVTSAIVFNWQYYWQKTLRLRT